MNMALWGYIATAMALATLTPKLKTTFDDLDTKGSVKYWSWRDQTVYQLFDKVAKKNQEKTAFQRGNEIWSFKKVQEFSLKVANYFSKAGIHRGDIVALAGVVGPDSIMLWLGLSRLGAATALLPPKLSPNDILKAASKVFSKALICSPDLVTELKKQTLPQYMILFSLGPSADKSVTNLKEGIENSKSERIKKHKMTVTNKLLYFFSPTTLIPMPVTNYRYIYIAKSVHRILSLTPKDVVYSAVPQVSPDGSIVAAGQTIIFGNQVVLGENPAANAYFPECDHYGATVALYDADTVKQLLALPPSDADTKHKVQLLVGSGLYNPEVWTQFKERFKVPRIGEYYVSVDSDNYIMVNSRNKAGAIGFIPSFSPLQNVKLVAFDPKTGEEVRNKKGLCESPANGQPGIFIDAIPKDPLKVYFSKNKKITSNVFTKGDKYINTGDILKKDKSGYYYLMGTIDNIKGKSNRSSA